MVRGCFALRMKKEWERSQTACKPGSVRDEAGRSFLWDPHCCGPHATNPNNRVRQPLATEMAGRSYSVLLPVGFTVSETVAGPAVRSYRTVSPLPAIGLKAKAAPAGGLFSVALSLGSPPPAVNRYRCPMEPGLSSRIRILILMPAIVQPSGRRKLRLLCVRVKSRLLSSYQAWSMNEADLSSSRGHVGDGMAAAQSCTGGCAWCGACYSGCAGSCTIRGSFARVAPGYGAAVFSSVSVFVKATPLVGYDGGGRWSRVKGACFPPERGCAWGRAVFAWRWFCALQHALASWDLLPFGCRSWSRGGFVRV